MSKIVLITTGGTIASIKTSEAQGAMPVLTGNELLKRTNFKAAGTVCVIDFSNEDSSRLGPEDWSRLSQLITKQLNDLTVSGIVVTHGTDTLAEASFFLALTIVTTRPIIITGAMLNASESSSDGLNNLKQSLSLINQASTPKEVQIYFNNKMISPYHVEKLHTHAMDSINAVNKFVPLRKINFKLPLKLAKVPLISSFAGDDGVILKQIVATNPDGIIIEALGAGNVSQALAVILQKAIKQEIVVVITSKVPFGEVVPCYGGTGGASSLANQGVIIARHLRGGKARILLMLGLSNNLNIADFKKIFQ